MASQEQDMDVSLIDLMTSEGVGGDSLKLLSKKHLEKNRHPSANVLFDLNEDEKPKPVTANTDEEPICNRLIEVQVPPKSYRIRGVAVAVGVSAGILVVVDILHATMNKAVTTVLVTVIASIAMLVMTEIRNWKKVAAAAATATEGLSGQPKVAKHVREAKDLLIKIIAKETSELQRELSSQAKEEGAPQRRLINMSQGVPCLPIFEASRDAMVALIDERRLPYSDVAGELEVREAAAEFINHSYRQHGANSFSAENVVITSGAIQAIFNCLALCIEGASDVVATPLPAYGLYKHQTALLGGSFVTFGAGQRLPTPQAIRELFTSTNGDGSSVSGGNNAGLEKRKKKIRALVLVLPNNPTGAVLDDASAKSLCSALDEAWDTWYATDPDGGFTVVLDEVYLGITAAQQVVSLLSHASRRLRQSLFLVLSCSKGLGAMPGARAAWVTAPSAVLAKELCKVQLATTGNASTISQAGLKAALDHVRTQPQAMEQVWAYYQARTSLVASRLRALGKAKGIGAVVSETEPEATFYVWADFSGLPRVAGKSTTDLELGAYLKSLVLSAPTQHHGQAQGLAADADGSTPADASTAALVAVGVAAVPGSAFDESPQALRLRFSCACEDLSDLELAMNAVEYAVEAICASAATTAGLS